MRLLPPLALAVPALLATPAAAVPNLAAWNGPAAVAPCGAGSCVTATTDGGSCTAVTAGGGPVACSATLSGTLTGPGCAGTGTGSAVLRETTGEEHTVSVTLVATGGTVAFSGRYVFLFDRTAYFFDGTVECGAARWTGTFAGRGL